MANQFDSPWQDEHREWVSANVTDEGTRLDHYNSFREAFPGHRATYEAFARYVRRLRSAGVERAPEPDAEPGAKSVEETELYGKAHLHALLENERKRMLEGRDRGFDKFVLQTKILTDALVDAARELVPTLPKASIPVLSAPASDSRAQTALLMLSDLHVGAKVDPEETGGFGEYNYPAFRRRLFHLQDTVRSITQHHRQSHAVPHLVVSMLGDMIEGTDVFPSQGELVDLDLMAQIFNCVEDVSQFLVGLLDTFETIFVPSVTGNHGRVGRRGQHKRHINYDYAVAKMLEYKLSGYADRIQLEIPKAAFAAVDIQGYTFLLRHGDGIKGTWGIPFYGVGRSVGRWTQIQSAVGDHFDYLLLGHFHQHTSLSYTGSETLINGSFPGTTEYAIEVLETVTRPMQWFGMVHPTHGLASRYPVWLETGGPRISRYDSAR